MAEGTAYLRAVHMILDGEPKIFDDPLAAQLLGPDLDEKIEADKPRLITDPLVKARALIVMRSRYVDDELVAAVERGITQYVILGAGLDTSPYLAGHLSRQLGVFEVDHPDTQRLKIERLAAAGIEAPVNLCYVPIDFETQSLADALAADGFDADQTTFFSWLGVSYYLQPDSVRDVLAYVAGLAPCSQLVFDFMLADSVLGDRELRALAKITAFLEKYREPLLCRFEPQLLQDLLHSVGFSGTEHLNWADAMDRYFKGRADGMHLDPTTQIMSAVV